MFRLKMVLIKETLIENQKSEKISHCVEKQYYFNHLKNMYVAENCENKCRKKNSMPDDQLFSGLRNLRETWR